MIIANNGQMIEEKAYKNEQELQALIFQHPELLNDEGSELVSVMRELNTKVGRIDVLMITASGVPTLVEVKLARNSQSRREVLAQILDYISELTNYSYYELDEATHGALGKTIDGFENNVELPRIIEDNLRNGLTRLIITVDETNDDLRRLVEFVAKHTDFRVDLIEIKKYLNGDEYFYGSNTVVQSSFTSRDERSGNVKKEYPLLDQIVKEWTEKKYEPQILNSTRSYRQVRVEGWPSAVHYEFTILHNQPVVYVRLDNELYAGDKRSAKISETMQQFIGKKIDGYTIEARLYSRSGGGQVIYAAVPEAEISKACEVMLELIKLTRGTIEEGLKNN